MNGPFKVVRAHVPTGARGPGEWLPRLEPDAAGQRPGREACSTDSGARATRLPLGWLQPPEAAHFQEECLFVHCARNGAGQQRCPRGLLRGRPDRCAAAVRVTEPMINSAGTTRHLCASYPLIACTVLLPLSHRQ
eukprot:1002577-Prymnesium_polylepis.1